MASARVPGWLLLGRLRLIGHGELVSKPLFDGSPLRSGHDPLPAYRAGVLAVLGHEIPVLIEHLNKAVLFGASEVVAVPDLGVLLLSHSLI